LEVDKVNATIKRFTTFWPTLY